MHIGDNPKSICFSKSFNVVIEEIENNAFVSLVKLKDIIMHHNKEKKSHKLSFMSIDYSSQHVTNEDTQHVILNAVTKMEISDSKCFFTKETLKCLRASKKSHVKKMESSILKLTAKEFFNLVLVQHAKKIDEDNMVSLSEFATKKCTWKLHCIEKTLELSTKKASDALNKILPGIIQSVNGITTKMQVCMDKISIISD